jgi:hypothetical protein
MLKYLAAFALILGLAVYIACQDERTAQQSAQNATHLGQNAVAAKADEQHPQENVGNPERHIPSWYGFFRWPNGTTTWAIILTLLAIAEQTKQTAKAAKAANDSVQEMQTSVALQKSSITNMRRQTRIALVSARTAQTAAEFARRAVWETERADVLLESVEFGYATGTGKLDAYSWVILRFKNFGRTRAEDVGFKASLLAPGIVRKADQLPRIVLGPSQDQSVQFERFGRLLTMKMFQDILLGKQQLKFEAWVTYKDVFGSGYTSFYTGTFDHRLLGFTVDQQVAG